MRATCVALGALAAAFASVGCSSNDCTETATCAAPADGSTGSDATPADASSADRAAPGDSASASDAGDSTIPPGDSGTGTDAMTLPDVVFIDAATCLTGSQCVDPVPAGWAGPLALSDQASGPPAPTPPACPASFPNDAYDGHATPTSAAAVCGCTCGSPTGADCNSTTPLGVTLYAQAGCTGTVCGSVALPYAAQGFCVSTSCSAPASAQVTLATAQNASCPATPSQTNPPTQWSETARACQPSSVGGGCPGAQVCVTTPPSPFSPKLCVMQVGDVACPSSYTQKHMFYSGVTDGRGCTACTCTPSGIACVGGTVGLATSASGSMCAGTMDTVPTDGNCYGVSVGPGNTFAWTTQPPAPMGGTCAASSVTATGSVTASGPTTVCCQP